MIFTWGTKCLDILGKRLFFSPYFKQNIESELGKAVEAGRGRSWKPYRQCLDANFKNYN